MKVYKKNLPEGVKKCFALEKGVKVKYINKNLKKNKKKNKQQILILFALMITFSMIYLIR